MGLRETKAEIERKAQKRAHAMKQYRKGHTRLSKALIRKAMEMQRP